MAKDSERPLSDPTATEETEQTPHILKRHRDGSNVTNIGTRFQARWTTRRRLIAVLSALLALLVILGAVSLVVFRDKLNLDRARRWLNYLNVETRRGVAEQYSFESHKSNVYAPSGDGLAIGSVSGLTVFDVSGNVLASQQAAVSSPCLKASRGAVILADLGRKTLCRADLDNGETATVTLEDNIYAADMAANGSFVVLTGGQDCKAIARVYNAAGTELFQWRSATHHLTGAALKDDGSMLAVAAGTSEALTYHSILQLLSTASSEGPTEIDLGEDPILMLDYLGASVVALGQEQVSIVDKNGEIAAQYAYDTRAVTGYAATDGFAAISMDAGLTGQLPMLTTLNENGDILGQAYLTAAVKSLSAAGKYVAVLCGDTVTVYNRDLSVYAQLAGQSGVSQALMRTDGTVLLVGGGQATLYIPD